MAFDSIAAMLRAAREQGLSLREILCQSDSAESGLSPEASLSQMKELWAVMLDTSEHYCPADRSNSGLIGGDAQKVHDAAQAGRLLGGPYLQEVIEEALKTAECNACMKRIVAAPTAGSCGVLPAVLIPLYRSQAATEEQILDGLYIAAGFGQVTAARASLSGCGRGLPGGGRDCQRHGRRRTGQRLRRQRRPVRHRFRHRPGQPAGLSATRGRAGGGALREAQRHRRGQRHQRRQSGPGRGHQPHPRRRGHRRHGRHRRQDAP